MENNEQIIEVEINEEMVAEDLAIQASGNEEELIQDVFNEDNLLDIDGAIFEVPTEEVE